VLTVGRGPGDPPCWAPLDALPTPLLRYTEIGIGLYRSGQLYATVDWPDVLHAGGGG
jgi:hypothetical protein